MLRCFSRKALRELLILILVPVVVRRSVAQSREASGKSIRRPVSGCLLPPHPSALDQVFADPPSSIDPTR